jgi:hypothetical protein
MLLEVIVVVVPFPGMSVVVVLLHNAFELSLIVLLPFPVLAFLFAPLFPIIVIGGTGDDTYGAEGQQGQKDFELHLGDSMN